MTRKNTLSHLCATPGCGKERRWKSHYCSIECLFWSHFDKSPGPDGCWLWTGSVNPVNGYGAVSTHAGGGKRTTAHRRAFTLTYGDPGHLSVLHRCDVNLCGNPAHLFAGTPLDNWLDSVAKGRQTAINPGEANAAAKLTPAKVISIRRSSSRASELARKHRVTYRAIRAILRRETWRHVPEIRDNGDHPEWVFLTGVMDRPAPHVSH